MTLRRSTRKRKLIHENVGVIENNSDEVLQENLDETADDGKEEKRSGRKRGRKSTAASRNVSLPSKKIGKTGRGKNSKVVTLVKSKGEDDEDFDDEEFKDEGGGGGESDDGKEEKRSGRKRGRKSTAASRNVSSPSKKIGKTGRGKNSKVVTLVDKDNEQVGEAFDDEEFKDEEGSQYSETGEEEYEEVFESKRRKRASEASNKGKSGISTPSSSRRSPRDYGSVEDRTCPFCKKVFSIITGLAYHIGK